MLNIQQRNAIEEFKQYVATVLDPLCKNEYSPISHYVFYEGYDEGAEYFGINLYPVNKSNGYNPVYMLAGYIGNTIQWDNFAASLGNWVTFDGAQKTKYDGEWAWLTMYPSASGLY